MSREWILERFSDSFEMGAFGRLMQGGNLVSYSVEQPWNDNIPSKSCVPAGRYELVKHKSPKWGDTFALRNHDLGIGVNNGDSLRFGCLIHTANRAAELEGCIALGVELGFVAQKWAVTNSATAVKQILSQIQHGDTLTIIWKDHP